ncbi:MAG: hypothetical protein IB618_02340 [Candidatus Pacearchaeota archaeon]|nr:MAG: hypothetical protein IB618_02340 [Candidatus Pacearchaeota archaeon]
MREVKEYIIDRPKLVFDYALPIFQSLVEDGHTKVRVSPEAKLVGVAIDMVSFIHRFCYKDLTVILRHKGETYFFEEKTRHIPIVLELIIDENILSKNFIRGGYKIITINPPSEYAYSRASISSAPLVNPKKREFSLDDFLHKFFNLKSEHKSGIMISCNSTYGFKVDWKYQKDNLVSEMQNHYLDSSKTMKKIAQTLFHYDWSVILSVAVDVMAGRSKEEIIKKRYPEEEKDFFRERLDRKIEKAIHETVPCFIKGLSRGENSYEICKTNKLCGWGYSRLYGSKIMSALVNRSKRKEEIKKILDYHKKITGENIDVKTFLYGVSLERSKRKRKRALVPYKEMKKSIMLLPHLTSSKS